jgi:hypothetical protein
LTKEVVVVRVGKELKPMPPHCDTMDGPVVRAAAASLEAGDAGIILPYVSKEGEEEVRRLFEQAMLVRGTAGNSEEAVELAGLWFFENVVRIHRAGEGEPYTGLKPAGLSEGPVIPVAEHAIEEGKPDVLVEKLTGIVEEQVRKRFATMMHLAESKDKSIDDGRAYVQAMLGLQVWSHQLYLAAEGPVHAGHGQGEAGHGEGHQH